MRHTIASTHTGGALYEIGAMMAGYRPIWGVEIRPDIADVAERNIPGLVVIRSDVAAVDYATLPKVDHLHSSPKCKSASIANSNGGERPDDISSAQAICRAIRQVRPKSFSLENVWQYRNYESFKLILTCLKECSYHVGYWHLNAADYGVPQTRKRLILIARLDRKPHKPPATHYKPDAKKALQGMRSMFWRPWVGWYEAIEDLIDTLPDSEFAPWQVARMPMELKTMLLAQGGYDGQVVNRLEHEPAMTITANNNQTGLRAFLLPGGGNTNFGEAKPGKGCRYADEPTMTVTTAGANGGGYPRAFIIPGDNTNNDTIRLCDEPMVTVRSRSTGQCPHRAFVVGSQYIGPNTNPDRPVQTRTETEPHFTVTASEAAQPSRRAYVNGRVVQMAPRALARFQSVPDSYALPDANGLACEIIGNGVSCLMSKAICEAANG